MSSSLALTRDQILSFRRRANGLDQRAPHAPDSLRRAAWAGLQDSMPRAALLSIHARVSGAAHSSWQHKSLIQVWGPRYQLYVIAAADMAVFTLGRLPADGTSARERAERLAEQLHAHLAGRTMTYGDAGDALGVNANALRYAATTGTVQLHWGGARLPTIWSVPRPQVDPVDARLELARRYLHLYGPATAAGFKHWAGIGTREAAVAFEQLSTELIAVHTPLGDAVILADDEAGYRAAPNVGTGVRLLPSGDAYFLLWGADRALLVPDPKRRTQLWTPRVWPGAVLVDGEVRGIWRRANEKVTVEIWGRTPKAAVSAEAATLPLPNLDRAITVEYVG